MEVIAALFVLLAPEAVRFYAFEITKKNQTCDVVEEGGWGHTFHTSDSFKYLTDKVRLASLHFLSRASI